MRGAVIRLFGAFVVCVGLVAALFAACGSQHDGSAATGGTGSDARGEDRADDSVVGSGGAHADATTDTGAQPDAGDVSAELAWLVDPGIWQPAPGGNTLDPCRLYVADIGKLPVPALAWTPCGAGCAESDPVQGVGEDFYIPVASTHRIGTASTAFVTGELIVKGKAFGYGVRRTVRLADGVTVGAVERVLPLGLEWSPCEMGSGRESAFDNSVVGGSTKSVIQMTPPREAGQPWRWALPPKPLSELPSGIQFDTDYQGGQVFSLGKGSVWGLLDLTKSEWTAIESGSSSYHGGGEGDLAVWTDFGVGRIRGWAPDGAGVRLIVDKPPAPTCDVVPTPTHIIGWVAEGDGTCTVATTGRVWYVKRTSSLTTESPTLSPALPGAPFALVTPFGMRAWGDWVALNLWEADQFGALNGEIYFLLVQLSTWKAWRVHAAPDFAVQTDTFAMDDEYFYYGEAPLAKAGLYATRLRRLALKSLDQAPYVTPL